LENIAGKGLTSKGPPNLMNDLDYKSWMKFQKSFFRFSDLDSLLSDNILFFTKNQWSDGTFSRVLILENQKVYSPRSEYGSRDIHRLASFKSVNDIIDILRTESHSDRRYDFIFLDFRGILTDRPDACSFVETHSGAFSKLLREILKPEKYAGVLVDFQGEPSTAFPTPWLFALACRRYLRLRDEKIALVDSQQLPDANGAGTNQKERVVTGDTDYQNLYHLIFLQARDDERKPLEPKHEYIRMAKNPPSIPAWLIVRSPPRKKDEKHHPAKFPEPLIEHFIETFTEPGETVFDPMAGTGSALTAAARLGRNAVGMDIVQEFVDVARRRLAVWNPKPLEDWLASDDKNRCPRPKTEVLQGDATGLSSDKRLGGRTFEYCITSPPYWSVLKSHGSEYQKSRRDEALLQYYSDDPRDLGNIEDYDRFMGTLQNVYNQVAEKLRSNGHLTVIVKNVKREQVVYPIAWDLVLLLTGEYGKYDYVGNTLWCQDDLKIRPFALGIYWTSNILHHFCIHLRKRSQH